MTSASREENSRIEIFYWPSGGGLGTQIFGHVGAQVVDTNTGSSCYYAGTLNGVVCNLDADKETYKGVAPIIIALPATSKSYSELIANMNTEQDKYSYHAITNNCAHLACKVLQHGGYAPKTIDPNFAGLRPVQVANAACHILISTHGAKIKALSETLDSGGNLNVKVQFLRVKNILAEVAVYLAARIQQCQVQGKPELQQRLESLRQDLEETLKPPPQNTNDKARLLQLDQALLKYAQVIQDPLLTPALKNAVDRLPEVRRYQASISNAIESLEQATSQWQGPENEASKASKNLCEKLETYKQTYLTSTQGEPAARKTFQDDCKVVIDEAKPKLKKDSFMLNILEKLEKVESAIFAGARMLGVSKVLPEKPFSTLPFFQTAAQNALAQKALASVQNEIVSPAVGR